jgi:hypothetical protein
MLVKTRTCTSQQPGQQRYAYWAEKLKHEQTHTFYSQLRMATSDRHPSAPKFGRADNGFARSSPAHVHIVGQFTEQQAACAKRRRWKIEAHAKWKLNYWPLGRRPPVPSRSHRHVKCLTARDSVYDYFGTWSEAKGY